MTVGDVVNMLFIKLLCKFAFLKVEIIGVINEFLAFSCLGIKTRSNDLIGHEIEQNPVEL
jgi:hypothetical protein